MARRAAYAYHRIQSQAAPAPAPCTLTPSLHAPTKPIIIKVKTSLELLWFVTPAAIVIISDIVQPNRLWRKQIERFD